MTVKKGPPKKNQDRKSTHSAAFVRYTNQVANTVLRSIKMAGPDLYNQEVNPLKLLEMLKTLGAECLAWKPETLMAALDSKFGGWTREKVADALESFQNTGVIQSDIPTVNRHKLYALRIIMTSDTAHHEWHVFEKVGSAFNNRPAHFGVVEPLTPAECAITVALLNTIRPDQFSHEVLAYIAASCHEAGLYTVSPSKYLGPADNLLSMMNKEETGRVTDVKISSAIADKLAELRRISAEMVHTPEDFVTLQALRLLAADTAGDLALKY